jgi:hypothetical protein
MIAITGKVTKGGQGELARRFVPANHSEAHGIGAWGLIIAGSLLLITTTFIVLLLLAA